MQVSSSVSDETIGGFDLYQFDKPCKSICSLSASDTNIHRFALGTSEYSTDNTLTLVDFDESSRNFTQIAQSKNLPPVEHLIPFGKGVNSEILVVFRDTKERESYLSLLKVDLEDSLGSFETLVKLDSTFRNVKRISYDPYSGEFGRFCVISRESLCLFKESEESFEEIFRINTDSKLRYSGSYHAGAFDPHHSDLFGISIDNCFEIIDFRQKLTDRITLKGSAPHKGAILDLKFNPNVPNEVITVGEDTRVYSWDLRATLEPTVFDSGHNHWIQEIHYNTFHDQLLLTCGATGIFLHTRNESLNRVYHNPQASVCTCWSEGDAWHYGSIVSRGLLVESVPKDIKFKLL
ncbi:conserved hypothetical protein [Theileria equi strain WA]|uniref:EIPR1-like beta-propeller domain-containing protein n=1 Tax=Theileria equi strain WA TaxID=1537102 RepID=L1LFP3_THEEQ|nr:conserved hypothetical protein [Theileria equi strain WA]EKX74176.1 conserved hypothetical protein [Theileria equi strain WA]|eukprot:XP_004833628.1 conserved hypothetical protein [Theileria equi strain WA]